MSKNSLKKADTAILSKAIATTSNQDQRNHNFNQVGEDVKKMEILRNEDIIVNADEHSKILSDSLPSSKKLDLNASRKITEAKGELESYSPTPE